MRGSILFINNKRDGGFRTSGRISFRRGSKRRLDRIFVFQNKNKYNVVLITGISRMIVGAGHRVVRSTGGALSDTASYPK